MTPEIIKMIADAGAAVAVIVVVVYFLRFIGQERESTRAERQGTMEIIGNHLDHSSEAIRQAGESIKEAAEINAKALRSVVRHCRKAGGNTR